MSQGHKRPLSKRSSVWESTFILPNYTRPQGWQTIDPGPNIYQTPEELEDIILDMLTEEFGGISLAPAEMDSCIDFVIQMSSGGYGLSSNRLKRILGLWISTKGSPLQTEYNESYRELSFN